MQEHKDTGGNTETISYGALVERVEALNKQLEDSKRATDKLSDRLRDIELYNSSQKDVPNKIQHNEELIKEIRESNEAADKEKHDYVKEFILIVVSGVSSYILSKLS